MTTDPPPELPDPAVRIPRPAAGSVTRGFLFADLRGYTSFVETHGAASAVDLLTRFRFIVREQIERFDGAEIRTEGDSFYVVFGSVSDAVRSGLAISEAARLASPEPSDEPIRVGIGIHAGETVETPEGYVGSAVNIAARICAVAAPGEVLVSDTVRALTQTLLPVRFVPRGRRQLKGLADPVALFAVEPTAATGVWGGRRSSWGRRRWVIGAAAAAGLAALALAWAISRPAAGLPPGPWKIGLDMPLTGAAAFRGGPMRDAVQLAIDEANAAGGIGGATLKLDARDDVGDAGQDPDRGARPTLLHSSQIRRWSRWSGLVAPTWRVARFRSPTEPGCCSAAHRTRGPVSLSPLRGPRPALGLPDPHQLHPAGADRRHPGAGLGVLRVQ
jgi:class 3 adenylate cyclase